ncbi:MAG TPA: thiamine pyrophosphate-binding protein [Ktedonobacteraceae bacterium]|nr:thiamine pyrophosphate-binding protein [Ktedonobacteraceae bacterium]
MTNKQNLTGAQAVIATLRAYNVDTIFGIPGVHTLPLYDAMQQEQGLRHILARHEQGAGFMADGYARISGRPGVVCTITGPGVTNVATPIADAYADSIPLLVISSGLPRASKGHFRGELHGLKNQRGVMEALAGWTRAVEYVEEIPGALADAFRVMRSGRPRGAYLEIPLDLLEVQAEVDIPSPTSPSDELPPLAHDAIMAAARMLSEAQSPLIIAGAGVTFAGANEQLVQLAELLSAPVLLGGKSHDVLPSDHPLVIPARGYAPKELQPLVESCDVVLVVGSKLGAQRTNVTVLEGGKLRTLKTSDLGLPLPAQLIHIDIDPAEIGHNYPARIGIAADARLALEALLAALSNQSPRATSRTDEIAQIKQALRNRARRAYGETVALLDGLREGLPRDGIVVADMTMPGYASAQYLPVYEPRTFIHPSELCAIGCGLPLALGAQVAAPGKPVVALCGDGGFLLNVGELATAVQEQLPVVTVIFNDATYTAVKSDQHRRFGSRYIATDLIAPDYVALAEAFHMRGMRAEGPEALRNAVSAAISQPGPSLIEVPLPVREW